MALKWIAIVALLSLFVRVQVFAANTRSRALSGLQNSRSQLPASRTVTAGSGECFEYDTDFPGYDLSALKNVPSPADCMARCEEQRGCAFWSYNSQTSYCYLKVGGAFASRREASGIISGPRLCEYSGKCFEYGYDYTGYDVAKYENQLVSTAEECQSLCYANPKCAFFSWKMSTLACYLKTSEAPMGRTLDASLVSGPSACRNKPAPPSPPSIYPGIGDSDQPTASQCSLSSTEYRGNDVQVVSEVRSAPACQALCRKSSACFFWTWDLDEETCSLKAESAKDTQFSDKTTLRKASGAKTCIPTRAGCHILGAGVKGAFLRSKSVGSYDLCLTECLLEPECFFWSFDFTLDKESCKLYSNLLAYTTSAVPYETVAGPVGCDADEMCYEQADYVGHDIGQDTSGSVKSPGDCQALCKKTDECQFWTFYARNKSCYLKDADALMGKVNDSTTLGRYSGPKGCFISSGCTELNTLYVGETLSQDFAADFATCASRCAAAKECTRWVYAVESKFCVLKTGETRQLKGSRGGLIAGAQHCPRELEANDDETQQTACYDSYFKYPTSLSIMFNNSVTSPGSCQALCKTQEGCKSFVFTEPSLCYLLPDEFTIEDDDVVIDPLSTSGPRECPETGMATWFDGYLVGHEDPDSPNDIAEEAAFVSTVGSCAARCTATPACESWTYYVTELEVNCRLFSDRPERVNGVGGVEGASVLIQAKSGYRPITPFLQGGTAFSTTPLQAYDGVPSLTSCIGLCAGIKECLYWTAILLPPQQKQLGESDIYTCLLHDYRARRATLSDPLATSGTAAVPGSQNIGLQVTIGSLEPVEGKALDMEGCKTECESYHNCSAFNFDFNAAENPCRLINIPTTDKDDELNVTYTEKEGVVSGVRTFTKLKLVLVSSDLAVDELESTRETPATAKSCLESCKAQGCKTWLMANNTCYMDVAFRAGEGDILGITGGIDSILPADYDIQSCGDTGGEPSAAESLEECREQCMETDSVETWTFNKDSCTCSNGSSDDPLKNLCSTSAGSSP